MSLSNTPTCMIECLGEAIKAVCSHRVSHTLVGPGLGQKELVSFERLREMLLRAESIDYCRKEDFEQELLARLAGTNEMEAETALLLRHVLQRVSVFEESTGSSARIWLRAVPSIEESPFNTIRDRNFPLHFDFDEKHKNRTRLLETLAGELGAYFVDPNFAPYTRDCVLNTVASINRYISWIAEGDGREALSDLSNPHLRLCKELERLGLAVEEIEVGISFIFTGNILHSGGLNYGSRRLLLVIDEEQ